MIEERVFPKLFTEMHIYIFVRISFKKMRKIKQNLGFSAFAAEFKASSIFTLTLMSALHALQK